MKAYMDNNNFYLPLKENSKNFIYIRRDFQSGQILVCRAFKSENISFYSDIFNSENETSYHDVLKYILDGIFNLNKRHATYLLDKIYMWYDVLENE
jgi:hypothetical protein